MDSPQSTEFNGAENPAAGIIDPPQPAKRGRGRPPRLETTAVNEGEPKVASKKRGPKKKGISEEATLTLANQIKGLHLIGSKMFGLPEIEISETESAMLADSIVAVCNEYGLDLSGKTGAAVQLLGVAGVIYVPRVIAIRQRAKQTNGASNT